MTSVLFLFGWFLGTASAMLFLTSAISALIDPPGTAAVMGVSAAVIGFCGVALILAFRGRERRLVRAQSYFLAVLVWFVGPLALALPMRFALPETGWLDAYTDTVSAFTTFGSVFLSDYNAIPPGLKIWRAVVAWLGGLSSLAVILVVLAPNKVGGLLVGRRHDPEHRTLTQWNRVLTMFTRILPVYVGATIILFLAFELAGVPAIDSLILAMGTISTSGIQAETGDLAIYPSAGVMWIAIIGMLAGGLGVLWLGASVRIRLNSVRDHWESVIAVGLCIVIATPIGVSLYLGAAGAAGLSPLDAIGEGLLTAVSLVTTSGYSIRPESTTILPLSIMLSIVAVGGVTVSTAGGFKVFRLLAMFAQSRRELSRLIYPHRILAMRVGEQDYDIQLMKAVWASFAIYCAAVCVLSVILAYDMPDYVGALGVAVATMSSIGPVVETHTIFEGEWVGFAGLSALTKLAMIVGMILGRLEILAALTLMNIRLVRA